MSKQYKITVKEICERTILVNAPSKRLAEETAHNLFANGDLEMDFDDTCKYVTESQGITSESDKLFYALYTSPVSELDIKLKQLTALNEIKDSYDSFYMMNRYYYKPGKNTHAEQFILLEDIEGEKVNNAISFIHNCYNYYYKILYRYNNKNSITSQEYNPFDYLKDCILNVDEIPKEMIRQGYMKDIIKIIKNENDQLAVKIGHYEFPFDDEKFRSMSYTTFMANCPLDTLINMLYEHERLSKEQDDPVTWLTHHYYVYNYLYDKLENIAKQETEQSS